MKGNPSVFGTIVYAGIAIISAAMTAWGVQVYYTVDLPPTETVKPSCDLQVISDLLLSYWLVVGAIALSCFLSLILHSIEKKIGGNSKVVTILTVISNVLTFLLSLVTLSLLITLSVYVYGDTACTKEATATVSTRSAKRSGRSGNLFATATGLSQNMFKRVHPFIISQFVFLSAMWCFTCLCICVPLGCFLYCMKKEHEKHYQSLQERMLDENEGSFME